MAFSVSLKDVAKLIYAIPEELRTDEQREMLLKIEQGKTRLFGARIAYTQGKKKPVFLPLSFDACEIQFLFNEKGKIAKGERKTFGAFDIDERQEKAKNEFLSTGKDTRKSE